MKKNNGNKKITDSLKTRAFHVGGYSMLITAFVIIIAVIVNVVAGAIPDKYTQIDVTSEGYFTLSDQTEEIVEGLTDEVEIDWISQSGSEDNDIQTLLEMYESMSSKIKLVKIDPDVEPNVAADYTDTLYNNSLIVKCGEYTRFVDYYDIYTADYTDYMTTGQAETVFDGEGAITAAIEYVTTTNHPIVYNITGHGEGTLSSNFSNAVAKQNIDLEDLSIVSEGAIPDDANAILINGPTTDISDSEKEIIQDYLAGGGNMLLMTNILEDGELTNIEDLMSQYGTALEDGVVIEGDANSCAYGQQYYLLPTVEYHKTTASLMENSTSVVLPLAQGITLTGDEPDSVSVTSLLQTSDSSYSKVDGYNITTYDKEDGDIDGPFSLGVAIEDKIDSDTKAHIAWFTASTLVDDTANEMVSGGNQDLFLNCLNWMCDKKDADLAIHSKTLTTEYLTVANEKSTYLTVMLVGVLPLIYLGFGIYTWLRRRRK